MQSMGNIHATLILCEILYLIVIIFVEIHFYFNIKVFYVNSLVHKAKLC